MRYLFFWDIAQRWLLVSYRRFGPILTLKMGRICCPETLVTNYDSWLRNTPEGWRPQYIVCGFSIQRYKKKKVWVGDELRNDWLNELIIQSMTNWMNEPMNDWLYWFLIEWVNVFLPRWLTADRLSKCLLGRLIIWLNGWINDFVTDWIIVGLSDRVNTLLGHSPSDN